MYDKFILNGRLRFFRFICLVEREKLILLPYAGKRAVGAIPLSGRYG